MRVRILEGCAGYDWTRTMRGWAPGAVVDVDDNDPAAVDFYRKWIGRGTAEEIDGTAAAGVQTPQATPPPAAVPVVEPTPIAGGGFFGETSNPAPPLNVEVTEPEPMAVESPSRPPYAGPGSSRVAWAAYAESRQVPITDDMTRDDIIDAVETADEPGEQS